MEPINKFNIIPDNLEERMKNELAETIKMMSLAIYDAT